MRSMRRLADRANPEFLAASASHEGSVFRRRRLRFRRSRRPGSAVQSVVEPASAAGQRAQHPGKPGGEVLAKERCDGGFVGLTGAILDLWRRVRLFVC
ncbi:hypothetical protein XA68_11717 [Ophiocordyceps unilateralis]|uniref:Uncharacterized protein n=1 Tax=Ophiocordyceps unilateralis TaxID=268505 RepID=A0A2A9PF06_OPHUN|nr:hypothetical protein XA68_11717 [Ophiocordyceps unilateralis]